MTQVKERKPDVRTLSEYPVFIASDITYAPLSVLRFYRRIRNVCDRVLREIRREYASFLPIDFVGIADNSEITPEEAVETISHNLSNAKLGIFYVGFPSEDCGVMLGRAKTNNLPIIFLYESKKEAELKRKDPKIWWQPKSKEEITANLTRGLITATSHNSFMIPESRYHNIVDEIKFKKQSEGLCELEQKVRDFFLHRNL